MIKIIKAPKEALSLLKEKPRLPSMAEDTVKGLSMLFHRFSTGFSQFFHRLAFLIDQ
jgi:hypothetical protein